MLNSLIAFIYLATAITAGSVLTAFFFPERKSIIISVAIAWLVVTFLTLFSPHPAIWYGASAIVLISMSPKTLPDRLTFYCALLPAVPIYLGWQVPFPGISYLFRLFYPTFLNLVLLLPLLLSKPEVRDVTPTKWQTRAAFCALAYVVLCALLDFRDTTFTNGIRLAFEHLVSMGLIIILFAKARNYPDAPQKILFGILLGGAIIAFIGAMQNVQGWLIYSEASTKLIVTNLHYQDWMEYRNGRLRVPATMNAIPFGVYMAICLSLAAFYVRRQANKLAGWILTFMFAYGIYASGSRGAVLMVAIVGVYYFGFYSNKSWLRYVTRTVLFGFILILFTTNLSDDLVEGEEHGTLGYRVDLVVNASDSIRKNPLLGTPRYIENDALQASMQGQAIIDIVNAYLGIALRYGLIAMLLYILALRYSIKHIDQSRQQLLIGETDPEEERARRLTLSITVAFALMIISVSLVDRLGQYYWILVFLCCAYSSTTETRKRKIGTVR